MIIVRTPFRISFFGGGTDLKCFFEEYGGTVISTTINYYSYINIAKPLNVFDYSNIIKYSSIECENDIANIKNPAIREALKYLNINSIKLSYDADLPVGTGMGSSSSFCVGLMHGLNKMIGIDLDRTQLAIEAIHLERELCNEAGGWQDQIATAFGGLNRIDFEKNNFTVTPIVISRERKLELSNNLLLFYTGHRRKSYEIQLEAQTRINSNIHLLLEMKSLAIEALKVLETPSMSLEIFGELLDQTWKLKRKTGSRISTLEIDKIYDTAIKSGAIGGKLLGAGGGGFLLFYVPTYAQSNVKKSLSEFESIPFRFENKGSEIIFNSNEAKGAES